MKCKECGKEFNDPLSKRTHCTMVCESIARAKKLKEKNLNT